jgi:hypothetical protein
VQASSAMPTIPGLMSLRDTSIKTARHGRPLTSAWSGEIVVATAWLVAYLIIIGVTIGSESLSNAIAVVARY